MSTWKSLRIGTMFGFLLGFFTLAISLCPVCAEAQLVANQLTSASGGDRLDDFVIKPGQALPTNGIDPARAQPQPLQPSNQAEPTFRPTTQPTLLPPSSQPRGMEVGLTRPETGGNARLGGGLEWQILQNPNGPHTAILFNPNLQVIAVYQIDAASGAITLKSVRNVSWDLQIEDYNSNKPAPKDIRAMQP